MFSFLSILVQMFIYLIFAHAVMSFLFAFNIISTSNEIARKIWQGLSSVLEPFYRPIRRYIPPMNGLDLSPLVLLVMISILRMVLPI